MVDQMVPDVSDLDQPQQSYLREWTGQNFGAFLWTSVKVVWMDHKER